MIKYFDSQYAGSVDLPDDDVGFEATPVNDRWLSDESLAYPLHKSEGMAKTMDRLGYDTLWFAERHFQREGYECLPNLLLLATHLAQVTEKLRFGCAFNIATMWHPLRLAEDFAMADHLTKGRVTFGMGRGYHTREVESFGSPMLDQEANRELFEEQPVKEISWYYEEAVKMVGHLGFFPMTDEQAKALENPRTARSAGLPSAQAAVESGSMLCATSDQVTEAIMEIEEKYPGLERLYVSCTLFGCSLELTLDQLQRFAEEVMPNFKHTPAS